MRENRAHDSDVRHVYNRSREVVRTTNYVAYIVTVESSNT